VSDDERCPTCGAWPEDVSLHRQECPRVGTCGQYGPPWLDPPWHPDVDIRWPVDWLARTVAHRIEVHGLGSAQ
jgi:hypothetical protein